MAERIIRCLVRRRWFGAACLKRLQCKWAKFFDWYWHGYLYYSCDGITFSCKKNIERVKTVTLEQFMLFMIMPIGGLLMAAFVMFVTRNDRPDDKPKHSK